MRSIAETGGLDWSCMNPESDCQWVALEGKYVGSRQRHILFCKCRACREASDAVRAEAPLSADPEVARRQEFLSTLG